MLSRLLFGLTIVGVIWAVSCTENVEEVVDRDVQRLEDIEKIEEFIAENNLGEFDTTASGARYIIADTGRRGSIDYNDIVAIDYTARLLDSTVIQTSIQSIAEEEFSSFTGVLEPTVFTYTQTGWNLDFLSLTNQFLIGANPGRGLGEAITEALVDMEIGGKLIILLPSDQAYEDGSFSLGFGAYEVVIYEIFPVQVPE